MDDVSPTVYEMLKNTGSPKLKSGHINAVKIDNGVISDESKPEDKRFVVGERYIAKYEDRFQEKNSVLFKIDYDEVTIPDGEEFGREIAKAVYGKESNKGVQGLQTDRWILLKYKDDADTSELKSMIGHRVFNPGVLHEGQGYLFFCKGAISLRELGYDRLSHLTSVSEFKNSWRKVKIIKLSDIDSKTDLTRKSLEEVKKYAIWGAGMLGETFAEMVELSGGKIVLVVDKAEDKMGKPFAGVKISKPEVLTEQADSYDYLLVAHHLRFEDIEREAIGLGVPKERIIMPYEV